MTTFKLSSAACCWALTQMSVLGKAQCVGISCKWLTAMSRAVLGIGWLGHVGELGNWQLAIGEM